ncbi:MAG: hypothetical protein FD145_1505 [Candidatus Saganbacteria bacterium]|uniref:Uncharacterized protein n=1 Tax=Candidatus Saganbacteria bacterium TaxID=2575572 RepID=A0A833KZT1_UNCSA|nr:MAG: hypothetical protein FD145_1505 [Candidatus Saganbacteria bacterium]
MKAKMWVTTVLLSLLIVTSVLASVYDDFSVFNSERYEPISDSECKGQIKQISKIWKNKTRDDLQNMIRDFMDRVSEIQAEKREIEREDMAMGKAAHMVGQSNRSHTLMWKARSLRLRANVINMVHKYRYGSFYEYNSGF